MTDKKNRSNDKGRDMVNGHQFPTDKELNEAMKEWKMEPSEKTKRKTLQRAMDGIQEARKESTKREKVVKMKRWSQGLVAGAAAVALFSLIVLNTDEFQNMFGAGPDSTGDNTENQEEQTDNNQEETDPTENNVDSNESDDSTDTNDVADETDERMAFPEVDRPETKEITTRVEGMEEVNTYNLLNDPSMPFTTYIRDNYHYEMLEKKDKDGLGETLGEGIRISQKGSDFILVDIVFFNEDVDYEQALQYVEQEIEHSMFNVEKLPEENFADIDEWATDVFVSNGDVHGRMALGANENDQYFYIYTQFIEEALDGWYAVKQVIVDEWQWKNTQKPLNE